MVKSGPNSLTGKRKLRDEDGKSGRQKRVLRRSPPTTNHIRIKFFQKNNILVSTSLRVCSLRTGLLPLAVDLVLTLKKNGRWGLQEAPETVSGERRGYSLD